MAFLSALQDHSNKFWSWQFHISPHILDSRYVKLVVLASSNIWLRCYNAMLCRYAMHLSTPSIVLTWLNFLSNFVHAKPGPSPQELTFRAKWDHFINQHLKCCSSRTLFNCHTFISMSTLSDNFEKHFFNHAHFNFARFWWTKNIVIQGPVVGTYLIA